MSLHGADSQFPLTKFHYPDLTTRSFRETKNKEGCKAMTLNPAQGLPPQQPAAPAANDDSRIVIPSPEAPKREAGWDPQEVWRTRVKSPSHLLRARYERDRR